MARIKIRITGKVSTGNSKKNSVGKTGKKLYESRAKLTGHINDGRK